MYPAGSSLSLYPAGSLLRLEPAGSNHHVPNRGNSSLQVVGTETLPCTVNHNSRDRCNSSLQVVDAGARRSGTAPNRTRKGIPLVGSVRFVELPTYILE